MSSAKTENLEAEIVIIGGGGTGLAAAVAAVEKGARVIVLEKRDELGGNTAFAEGIFAAESHVQKQAKIDARRDDLFKFAMDYAHWKTNPRIVRAFIDKSGDTIRWLEEKGVKIYDIPAYYHDKPMRVWHLPEGYGEQVIKVLAKNCKDLGVQLLCGTAGKRILTRTRGNVTGVLAEAEGKELRIETKSVIIATGGYAGNKELLKKYYPSYHDNMTPVGLHHMGDGLVMATEIGAATESLGILHLAGQGVPSSVPLVTNLEAFRLTAVAQEPDTLWVNKKGERFTNEGITFNLSERGNAVDRQPDKLCYTLFDAKIRQTMAGEGLIKAQPTISKKATGDVMSKVKMPELERELQVQADKGRVKISNSWDEIANWTGAEPRVLKTTIDEYNTACDQGYDPTFVKDKEYLLPLRTPPYYAIRGVSSFLDTIGGIKINEHMEVVDNQGNPIPGLYAGGVDAGGWESDTYCFTLSGSTFGFAMNSGRIAAENAVKYALGRVR